MRYERKRKICADSVTSAIFVNARHSSVDLLCLILDVQCQNAHSTLRFTPIYLVIQYKSLIFFFFIKKSSFQTNIRKKYKIRF